MFSTDRLKSILIRASLSEAEADLYLFIKNSPGSSIADACKALKYGKSTLYRAFESLKELGLITSKSASWENELYAESFQRLIQTIENKERKCHRLAQILKSIESEKTHSLSHISSIENLDENETFERYLDLSEMPWDSVLTFGNWEDLNVNKRNLIPIEKQFIKNRLKNGGKAFVAVTKEGPYTWEIIDYKNLDKEENRKSVKTEDFTKKPLWINVFEGNNYTHIINLDRKGAIFSVFVESPVIADFYRNFIYSQLV